MKYRNLGKWGLKVSEIALGSWVTQLSGTQAEEIAKSVVDKAFDEGVNFFDCADAYSGGDAERFLG
ncbi:MAG: aldo/keto reductase, partial [Clostridia bacterium]|nr:aldo/keto reductase [Clostridia bacterium]